VSPTAALPVLRDPLDPDVVERSGVGEGEPDVLRASRRRAAERASREPWPTGAEEEWRSFPPKDIPAGPLVGARSTATYTGEGLPKGAWVGDLAAAARERPDLVAEWIDRGDPIPTHAAFTALADALWSGGTFVYVPAGVVLERPIVVTRSWAAGDAACLSRTIVVAERGSAFTLVEDVSSEPGPSPRVAVPHLEVHAGADASVRYVHLQRYGEDVWNIGAQWYGSERGSVLSSFNVLLGSARTKLGVISDIRGDGAEVKLYGLVAAADSQRIDVNSFQRLDGKASQSDLLYLSALYESAKAVYYGLIRVEPTSSMTGSYQECRNLLLSDKAGAHPIPVLEILTNDVARCGHGATAGRIQEDEVFYVMTRGIDRRTAEQLLVRGSFARVLDRIPDAQVRARVLEALRPRIGGVEELELVA
jgi:Fe-S cluster assembly protein SufD